jgi:hypothetical protein
LDPSTSKSQLFKICSLHSSSWTTTTLPATFMHNLMSPQHWHVTWLNALLFDVIALGTRRPSSEGPYLFPHVFVRTAYSHSSLIMLELRLIKCKRREEASTELCRSRMGAHLRATSLSTARRSLFHTVTG